MARFLPLACLVATLLTHGSAAWATPEADAQMVQKTLPSLVGRATTAEAAAADGAAFFAGEHSLSRAFPDLAQDPLFQPGFVADARRGLLAAAQTRATARRAPAPTDLSPPVMAQWQATWERVHRAEADRDAQQGRLLSALAAGLAQAPSLSSEHTDPYETKWAKTLSAGATSESGTPAADAAQSAGNATRGLAKIQSAAIRQMAIPGDTTLETLIAAELAVPVPDAGSAAEQATAQARLARVEWARMLLTEPEPIAQRISELRAAMGPPASKASTEDALLVQAQKAAEAAAAQAKAANDSASTQLQTMVADLRARIAAELETESTRHADANARISEIARQIDTQRADLSTASAPLVSDRSSRFHKVLRQSRKTVALIRAERSSLAQITAEAASRQAAAEAELSAGPGSIADPATAKFSAAVSDYRAVHQRIRAHLDAEQTRILSLLRTAKKVRDAAYARASTPVQNEVPIAEEMARELHEIPALVLAQGQSYFKAVLNFPSQIIEVHTLAAVLIRLTQLVLLIGVWTFIRRRASDWIEAGLASLDPRGQGDQRPWEAPKAPGWMVAGDIPALKIPLTSVAVALCDLCLAGLLFMYLSPRVPSLGLVAFFFAIGALARLVPDLLNLVLITPTEARPALRVTSAGVRDRARWTVRILVLWWGLDTALLIAGTQILDAPRISSTAHNAALMVLGLMALVGLRRWAPEIRAKLASDGGSGALNTWVTAKDSGVILSTLRSAAGSLMIFAGMAIRLLTLIVEGRGGLGWLSAALARRQLKTDDGTTRSPITAEHKQSIRNHARGTLGPPTQTAQVAAAFEEWCAEHRQGMVALTADRGMGKSRAIAALEAQIGQNRSVAQLTPPKRLTDPGEGLLWLGQAAGLTDLTLAASDDLEVQAEALGAALKELPETLFIVDDAHRLFLRSVGCFDALRAALIAMQASSAHHFWLCTFHGPAFSFLDGIGAVSHMAVFRARIHVDPTPAATLRTWLENATQAAGAGPRYDVLLHQPGSGAHLQRMLERTSAAYWRLLAEASQGNPDVALDYWLSGLHTPENPEINAVDVALFQAPETKDLDELNDTALFTLSALIIHDGATLEELHASLNLPEGEVRGTCRSLEAMGIIEDEDGDETFEVTNRWLPAVERLLRRKSFLHRR